MRFIDRRADSAIVVRLASVVDGGEWTNLG
jgi:hypothetical protein